MLKCVVACLISKNFAFFNSCSSGASTSSTIFYEKMFPKHAYGRNRFEEAKKIPKFKSSDLENIIDLGKIDEHLKSVGKDFTKIYSELNFIRSYNTELNNFGYTLPDFTYQNPESLIRYTVNIGGNILNKTGDIDDLFKGFDRLYNITKKSFPNSEVTYKEIPRSIDFTKKYYDYPIEFTISGTE
jgi:hypothetical protein